MIKKLLFSTLLVAVTFLFINVVSADPRMSAEPGDIYAHFLLNPDNAGDEIDVIGSIYAPDLDIYVNPGTGDGYATATRVFSSKEAAYALHRAEQIPKYRSTYITITSDDNDTPCTITRRNGTVYKSNNWKSTIRILVQKVTYELICFDGVEQ